MVAEAGLEPTTSGLWERIFPKSIVFLHFKMLCFCVFCGWLRNFSLCVVWGHCAICDPKVTQKDSSTRWAESEIGCWCCYGICRHGKPASNWPGRYPQIPLRIGLHKALAPAQSRNAIHNSTKAEVVKIPDEQGVRAAISRSAFKNIILFSALLSIFNF